LNFIVLIPIFLFSFAAFVIGKLQAYLLIWLFHVPLRMKFPMLFGAFFKSSPWFAGVLLLPFIAEERTRYPLVSWTGMMIGAIMCLMIWGMNHFARRWGEAMQVEHVLGPVGEQLAAVWAVCVGLIAFSLLTYDLIFVKI